MIFRKSEFLNDLMKKLYFKSLGLVVFMSLLGEFIHRHIEPTNLVMLYLLAVVVSASIWGRGPAIFTSIISVIAFDFLFAPPRFTMSVYDAQYILTFSGLFIVGIVISELTAKMRERTIEASRRETQIELLKTKEKLQTAILNSISHDLRTPLVSITGALSSILNNGKHLDKEMQTELIKTAYDESTRLNRIFGNLLDMTRIESGTLKVSYRPCEMRDVIGVSLEELKPDLEERNVHIDIARDLPDVTMDFVFITKVLINLIDNAVKYSPPESSIYVSAQRADNSLHIVIKDEGFGISRKDLPKVFDKFYRGEGTEKMHGTGLGLPICKSIVEAHKGRIWLESVEGRGTTVTVELPLRQD